jgi:hypothetical protein
LPALVRPVEQVNINLAVVGCHGVSLHCVVDALLSTLKHSLSTTKFVADKKVLREKRSFRLSLDDNFLPGILKENKSVDKFMW